VLLEQPAQQGVVEQQAQHSSAAPLGQPVRRAERELLERPSLEVLLARQVRPDLLVQVEQGQLGQPVK
jgi:hypothetical protein